jgi:hypothetical protein
MLGDTSAPAPAEYAALWARDAERFNATFGAALTPNGHYLATSALRYALESNSLGSTLTPRPYLAIVAEPICAALSTSCMNSSAAERVSWS